MSVLTRKYISTIESLGKSLPSHCSLSLSCFPASDGRKELSVKMTTQTVLLDFSIPEDRDIAGSQQIDQQRLNQHLKTINEDFSSLKLELDITGKRERFNQFALAKARTSPCLQGGGRSFGGF